jgi:hypothetical protein
VGNKLLKNVPSNNKPSRERARGRRSRSLRRGSFRSRASKVSFSLSFGFDMLFLVESSVRVGLLEVVDGGGVHMFGIILKEGFLRL